MGYNKLPHTSWWSFVHSLFEGGLSVNQQMRIDLNQRTMSFTEPRGSEIASAEGLPGEKTSFEELLDESLVTVNSLQKTADREVQRLALGDVEDISQVVTAASQAELALRLVVEVRNKLVDAYQELARISI